MVKRCNAGKYGVKDSLARHSSMESESKSSVAWHHDGMENKDESGAIAAWKAKVKAAWHNGMTLRGKRGA